MRNSTKFAVLIAALALTNPGIAQSGNLGLDAVLIESSDLMQSGDSATALALLKRYEADYSSEPEFLNNLAVAHLGVADPVSAITILRQLVESDPIFSIVTHNLIELEMQSSDGPPDTISPVLFVQSTQSFFEAELANIEASAFDNPRSTARPIVAQATPPPASTHIEVIRNALQDLTLAWAEAWSAKNLETYFDFYAQDFLPTEATSHREWRIGRSVALNKPGAIEIDISGLTIDINGNNATARFEQHYSSSNYSDRVEKTLLYSYLDGKWKIVSETSIPIE